MRTGKIARLPVEIREELNKRLRDGALAKPTCAWLNALPEVRAILEEQFSNRDINDQNISDWRNGGFKEWEERQDKLYRIRHLAEYARKLTAESGGSIAEGAGAIASGKVLELLEATDGAIDPEQLESVIRSVVALRGADTADKRANTANEALKRKDQELALAEKKFMRESSVLFLKFLDDARAREIAVAPMSNETKINEMGKLMFGELWEKGNNEPR